MSEVTTASEKKAVQRKLNTDGGKKIIIDVLTSHDGTEQLLGLLGLSYFREGGEKDVVMTLKLDTPRLHVEAGLETATAVLLGIKALFNSRDYEAPFYELMPLNLFYEKAEGYVHQKEIMKVDVSVLIKEQKTRVINDFKERYASDIEGFKVDSSTLGNLLDRLEIDVKGNIEGQKLTEALWLENITKGFTDIRGS